MVFFWKTGSELGRRIDGYLAALDTCAAKFHEGFQHYLQDGQDEDFARLVDEVRQAETDADSVKRDLELALYTEALIPSARGDVLHLVDSLDAVPNRMESALIAVKIQRVEVPAELNESFIEMLGLTVEITADLVKSVKVLFEDVRQVKNEVDRVTELESKVDDVEQALIARIFESDMEMGQKLLLRDTVRQVANIADAAEDAGFAIELISAKRMF